MPTFFDDLFDRFHDLHADVGKAVDGLPTEALDWLPGPEMSSIAILVVHLTGAERYWIGDVALKVPSDRNREKEFLVHGLDAEELKKCLSAADGYAREALKHFSLPDLEMIRKSPRNEKTFSAGWCLMHSLEHSALHLGHIQLTRQLWDQNHAQ